MARPVTIDDLFNVTLVGDPRLSPDGTQVAYVVSRLDKAADDYRSAVWLVPTAGGEPRQLTSGSARDSAPRWSPDGRRIAFVSSRPPHLPVPPLVEAPPAGGAPAKPKAEPKPSPQVWVVPVDGGEARQLTNQPDGASSPAWSPDGQTIATAPMGGWLLAAIRVGQGGSFVSVGQSLPALLPGRAGAR